MDATSDRPGNLVNTRSASDLPLWHEAFFGLDWLGLRFSSVYDGRGVERGDGSPVIVVPGCFASDASLAELHAWLSRVGYRPYYSGIGVNARCPEVSLDLLLKTVDRAFKETGIRVTLIGHSLGGLLARGAALRRPEAIRRVITVGSPVNGIAAHPAILAAAELLSGDCRGECLGALQRSLASTVAETCIYSKDDGVVDWHTCLRGDSANIEVTGTHVGLMFNAAVYRAIGEVMSAATEQSECFTAPQLRVA
jgi:triacylglycerol lipase